NLNKVLIEMQELGIIEYLDRMTIKIGKGF
ncbi:hypothetical protein LCGC14_2479350, partial [marine sediment metagenome]